VFNASELERIDELVAKAEFEDGKITAGYRAERVKDNLQLKSDTPSKHELNKLVLKALKSNKLFKRVAIPRIIRPPLVSRYTSGMSYGTHVDDALMGTAKPVRTDLAVTVFLTEQSSYEGGELMVRTSLGELAVKLPRGDGVLYPATTIHRVNPIVSGERIAIVTWVQSHVRDPMQREILANVDRLKLSLDQTDPQGETTEVAFNVYSNLLRMWADG